MTSMLPPAPAEDDDRERKWIIEGLRQALARATVDELARLTSLLEPEADGSGNVAGWLVMLVADEMRRQHLNGVEPDRGVSAPGESDEAALSAPGESDEPALSAAVEGDATEPGLSAPEPGDTVVEHEAGAARENGDAQPSGLSHRQAPASRSAR